ncbi:response regulator [Heyndrickxia sporothermodurans]
MNNSSVQTLEFPKTNLFDEGLLKSFFNLQVANVKRTKASFSLVFISVHPMSEIYTKSVVNNEDYTLEIVSAYLKKQVRNSDIVFQLSNTKNWVILLSNSGEEEAKYFLKRIFEEIPIISTSKEEKLQVYLTASIIEVANSKTKYEDVLSDGEESLNQAIEMGPLQMKILDSYKEPEIEEIKVSIIEVDEIVGGILYSLLERTAIEYFDLNIQLFQDGDQFLQSTWYESGHTHLVIMNDILPKKSGIEVLHELRKMPNNKKYIILMMSKRKTEEDMIFAYESGVDDYITKPFNIKLFEAQVKRIIKRIRS